VVPHAGAVGFFAILCEDPASFQAGAGVQPVGCKLLATLCLEAGARPTIRIAVRTRIVQVERRRPGIAAIVASATANREAS